MPTHTDPVIINGSTDAEQLVVRGHTTQTKALQEWRKDATTLQSRITNDGRLQIGTFTSGMMDTDDSLIEAHRGEADTTKPKRGLHLMGTFTGALSDLAAWVVHELTLKGSSISALHSAFRVRLRNETNGATSNAELRGSDIEVINASTSGPMPNVVGQRLAVHQEAGATADAVYGLKIELTNTPNAYAVHANDGQVRFGGLSAGLLRADSNGDLSGTDLISADIPNGIITLPMLANGTPNQLIGFNAVGEPITLDVPALVAGAGSVGTLLPAAWGETVAVRDVVYFNVTDNQWYKADNNADTPVSMGALRGFVQSEELGRVQVGGIMDGFSGLTPGLPVYISDTPGAYTQSKPLVIAGGSQVVLCQMGQALNATQILVDPSETLLYMKRAVLAQGATLEIKHHSEDTAPSQREIFADISTQLSTLVQTYSSSNQNIGVPLNKAGALLTISAGTTGTAHLGRQSGNMRRMAQGFQVATAGIFSQFSVLFTTPTASPAPTGQVEWRLETDNAGKPSGTVLQSGLIPSPSANTVVDVPGLVYLNAATPYWLVLSAASIQPNANQHWNVWLTEPGIHAGGMWRSDLAVGTGPYPAVWTGTNPNIDLSSTVRTKEYVKLSMGFQHTATINVPSVRLWLKKTGAPTAALTCAIYSDNAGNPGTVIANGTSNAVASSTLAATYGWINFPFSVAPTITANTPYHIVLTSAVPVSATIYVEWGADNSSPSYAYGEMKAQSTTAVVAWASMPTPTHACFELNGLGSYLTKGMIGHWAGGDQSTFGVIRNDATRTTLKNHSVTAHDVTFAVEV